MLRIILSLLLFSIPAVAEEPEVVEEVRWPTYCIRLITINEDGTFLLDMPGWPYGMDDSPILVTTLDGLNENTTNCSPDDPRMNLE